MRCRCGAGAAQLLPGARSSSTFWPKSRSAAVAHAHRTSHHLGTHPPVDSCLGSIVVWVACCRALSSVASNHTNECLWLPMPLPAPVALDWPGLPLKWTVTLSSGTGQPATTPESNHAGARTRPTDCPNALVPVLLGPAPAVSRTTSPSGSSKEHPRLSHQHCNAPSLGHHTFRY